MINKDADPHIVKTMMNFFFMVKVKIFISDKTAGGLSGLENSEIFCLVAVMLDLDHPEWATAKQISFKFLNRIPLCSLPGSQHVN